jgi:pyridoxamine 5'-phosphate oxidase
MKPQDCIQFANANPVCYIATMDGDQPRVRAVMQMFADESGFYYALLSMKHVSRQLKTNPKVEVCYYNNPPNLGEARQMRLTGVAELVKDPALIKKEAQNRAFLEPIAGQPLEPILEIWRISHGEAHFWTMADVGKEVQRIPLERIKF